MADPVQPLVGAPDAKPLPDPDARGWSLEGSVGLQKLFETAATAPGDGKGYQGAFCLHPNQKDGFCLGLLIENDHNDASDSTDAADHDRYVLAAKKVEEVAPWLQLNNAFYVGRGNSDGASTTELGNDLLSLTAVIPVHSDFEFGFNLRLTHFIARVSDSDEENVPLQDLEGGASLVARFPDGQTVPEPEGVEDKEVIYDDLAGAQRLWKAYEAAELTEESEKLKNYFDQYKEEGDEEELPSAITEGVPTIESANSAAAAYGEGKSLELLLNGTDGQQMALGIPKGAYTLGYCGLGAGNEGISLQTQCVAGAFTLISYGIGRAKKLDRARRIQLPQETQQKNADELFLYQTLIGFGLFGGGILIDTEEQWGAIFAAGGEQALMTIAFTPDPARTDRVLSTGFDGVYEYSPEEGGFFGIQFTRHLRHHLFTQARVVAQSSPVNSDWAQQKADEASGRDAALEPAKAATLSTIGFETGGRVNFSGGLQTGLIRGGENPLALLGIQEQLTFSSGDTGVEAGIGATQGFVPGAAPSKRLRLTYIGLFGGRWR